MVCSSSAAFMWRCAWWRLRQQGKQSNARTAFTPCAVPCIGRCTRRSTSLRLSSWQPRLDVAEEKTGTRGSSYNKKRLPYEREQGEICTRLDGTVSAATATLVGESLFETF